MTVTSENKRNQYIITVGQTVFPYTFRILAQEHLLVLHTTAGVETELSLTTNYTVDGVGDAGGGDVTTCGDNSPYPTGDTITIIREVPVTQLTDYVENDMFPAESHERGLDKLTMVVQQIVENLLRVPSFAVSSVLSDLTIPEAASRAIGWNIDATELITYPTTPINRANIDSLDVDYSGSLSEMVTSIGANKRSVLVDTAGSLTANLEIPDNIHLIWLHGCVWDCGAYTLTINGPFEAGLYQVFSGDGSIAGLKTANVEWFGAIADGNGAGGGTDNGVAILKAIASDTKELIFSSGTYRCDSSLTLSNLILSRGIGWNTILDFTNLGAGNALNIRINGTAVRDIKLIGNLAVNGINGSGEATECEIANVYLANFAIGLQTSWFWSNILYNVQIYGCTLAWSCETQSNNIESIGMKFINCDQFIMFQTAYGVNLTSPQFQNITDAETLFALSVRQSTVTITNPYFENLINADIAIVGGNGDDIGSTLDISGGEAPGNADIIYREFLRHTIRVKGVRNGIGISNMSLYGYWFLSDGLASNTDDDTILSAVPVNESVSGADVVWFDGKNNLGNATSFVLTSNKYITFSKAEGITVSWTGLTPGNPYTLIYAVRRTNAAHTIAVRWWEAGEIVQTLSADNCFALNTSDWELRYIPFNAIGDHLQLMSSDHAIEVKYIMLSKGHVFPKVDINKNIPVYTTAGSSPYSSGNNVTLNYIIPSGKSLLVFTFCASGATTGTSGLYLLSRMGTGTYVTTILDDASAAVTINGDYKIVITNDSGADRSIDGRMLEVN